MDAPWGKPPGDVYHESMGGTMNDAAATPSSAPINMRIKTVFIADTV